MNVNNKRRIELLRGAAQIIELHQTVQADRWLESYLKYVMDTWEPCSWCAGSGFVDVTPCRECGGIGGDFA